MSVFLRKFTLFCTLNLLLFLKREVAADELIYLDCSDAQGDLTYQFYVHRVLTTIYNQARVYNYGAWSTGGVNGAAQCRGDINTDDCLRCISQVINTLLNRCIANLEALVYSDYCQLRYTDKDGWPGYDEAVYYCSAGDISFSDKDWYNEFMIWLFNAMANQAYVSTKFMAYGSVAVGPSTVYAYAQCYNFLDRDDCFKCIQTLGGILHYTCASPYFGGRVVAGSCTLRYELYPFLNKMY